MTAPQCLASFVLAIALVPSGCARDACDCSPSGIYISTHGAKAKSMALSGPACADARVSSSVEVSGDDGSVTVHRADGFVPDAFDYSIQPAAAGDCTVQIGLESGAVVEKTVTFKYSGGDCCAGYYTSDSMWDLHTLELALDAGTR
jgi:hypothetical protein